MKRCLLAAVLGLCVTTALAGCGGSRGDAESAVGEATSALEDDNALDVNALDVNALDVNALDVNALDVNALDVNALAALQDPSPNGDLMRAFVAYAASCALDAGQSFDFSWTDALGLTHDESYPGLLGLAPTWATGPLSTSGAGWVSACVISRVNWYGVHVTLSSRGQISVLRQPSRDEMAAFPYQEGAFWGNLFQPIPTAYACHDPADDDHSRAAMRVCATGWIDDAGDVEPCGIIQLVGPCSAVCNGWSDEGQFWEHCGGVRQAITTYLQ
jgi:hypothetical protein